MYYAPSTSWFYDSAINGVMPADAVEITAQRHADLIAGQGAGQVIFCAADGMPTLVDPPPPTVDQRIKSLLARVDAHLNAAAKVKGYDSIITAALRAGYPGPFHGEGVAFAIWMDAAYAKCYELLAQFKAGEIEEPTAEQLIAMLPALQLPST